MADETAPQIEMKSGFASWSKTEQRVGDRLPYDYLLDDRTVVLRDGALMQSIYLEGFAFETADTDEVNHRQIVRAAALRAVGSSRFVVYQHHPPPGQCFARGLLRRSGMQPDPAALAIAPVVAPGLRQRPVPDGRPPQPQGQGRRRRVAVPSAEPRRR
jgi:hypothetical protein